MFPTAGSGLLGLYWGVRKQTLGACAGPCRASLSLLRKHGFGKLLSLSGRGKNAREQRVGLSLPEIGELLKKGRMRTEIGKKLIPELGYSLHLWSGVHDGGAYSLNIQCGGYSEWVDNNFVLSLPAEGQHSLAESTDRLVTLFHALVALWQPEQGILCDSSSFEWEGKKIAQGVPAYARYDGVGDESRSSAVRRSSLKRPRPRS